MNTPLCKLCSLIAGTISLIFVSYTSAMAGEVISVIAQGNTFIISRDDATGPCVAYYRTVDGSAIGGVHYIETSGEITFADGEKTKRITVTELNVNNGVGQFYTSGVNRSYSFEVWNDVTSKKTVTRNLYNADKVVSYANVYSNPVYVNHYNSQNKLRAWDMEIIGDAEKYENGEWVNDKYYGFTDYPGIKTGITSWTSQFTNLRRSYLAAVGQTYNYGIKTNFTTGSYIEDDAYMGVFQIYAESPAEFYVDADMDPGAIGEATMSGYSYGATYTVNANSEYYLPTIPSGYSGIDERYTTIDRDNGECIYLNPEEWEEDGNDAELIAEAWSDKVRMGDDRVYFPNHIATIGICINGFRDYPSDDVGFDIDYASTSLNVEDLTAPQIVAVHTNTTNTYAKGETMTIAVEFDEIVTISSTATASVKFGTSSTVYSFSYAGGSGTNVLYFSGIAGLTTSTGITLSKISSAVSDLSRNSKTFSSISVKNSNVKIANQYAVTLITNGGTIYGGNVSSYIYGVEKNLPTAITKDGYTFGGWYTSSDFTGTAVTSITNGSSDKTYYAKWIPNVYNVVLNTNGGSITANNVTSYTVGTGATLPTATDFIRTGYTFNGWYTKTDFSDAQVLNIDNETYGDKEFYAQWIPNNFTITLNNQEASATGTTEVIDATYDAVLSAITVPTKDGYTFGGYYTAANGLGTQYYTAEGKSTKALCDLTEATTLYAKWTPNTYMLTLDNGNATVAGSSNVIVTYNNTLPSIAVPNKTGYSFGGYYSGVNGTGTKYYTEFGVENGNTWSTADNGTLYACWTANTYNIAYEVNGGNIVLGKVESYTYGEGATLPKEVTKEGYSFQGWYSTSYFEGEARTQVTNTDLGDKTFYAKWNVNTYNVTLNANEGSINSGNMTNYVYGSTVVLPSDVTKTGYTFNGWFDNENFDGEAITTIANNEVGDKVFYAMWAANEYTITYEVAGGLIEDANYKTSYTFGNETTLPATMSKTGHKFAGWFTNSLFEGSAVTGISATEYGNKTFYAKWNVNNYKVTLNANGGTINNGKVSSYIYGTTILLPIDVTKTGYTFNGWYDNAEFEGEPILTISSTDLGDKTFYAKFSVNTYNVILVTNEGVINSGNIESYEFGKGATLPTDVTKTGYTFSGWYTNSSYIGGSVASVLPSETGDKTFYAKWTVNEYKVSVDYDKVMGTVTGEDYYEYKSTATLKAIANEGYEFVGWNDGELKDERIQLTVTKDTTLTANFKEKEKVQISGTLEIPTLKTEREAQSIDLNGLFTTTEGGEVTYSAASSSPNVVAATVSEGKLFLTVYEYEGEAEISVTATLPNGEKNTVKATATVVLACNIQVEETITNISCYGESDGKIALKVTNAAEPYTTLWTGDATEDTLRNVTAGNYTVVITDNENCSFTKTYTVSQPDEMNLSAKIKNPTCENADGAITVTLTGAESAAFAWSNGATTQNAANLAKGDYSLVVINTETGCQIGDNFTLVEPEAPVVTVSNVVETACNESAGAVTISVSEEGLIYNWSNNKHTKNLTNVPAGDYTLSVVNPETNCTATLEVTVPSIKLKQPEIALVTVSEQTGKNLVVWLKENTDLIQRYNIYRESETANAYTKIAEVPYSELSVYEDLEANPAVTAWRYKISATDVCNEETELGEYHKTIHLMQNQGLGGVYNLDWNTYEGLDFPTYVVIRKSVVRKVVTMDTIAYLSSNNNTYTDTLPAKGTQAYYVGMVLPEEINPMTQFMKAESGPFSIALSNIAEVESDGPDAVYDLSGSNAKAYAWGHTIYVKGAAGEDVAVYDVKGRKIDAAEGQDEYEFNVRLDGVYFVKVGEYTFKVVVE